LIGHDNIFVLSQSALPATGAGNPALSPSGRTCAPHPSPLWRIHELFDLCCGGNGPRDPILGLNEAFNADSRSTKVNLGVGVYFDDNGKIPCSAPSTAEKARLEAAPPRGYQPIEGPVAYNSAVQNLLFGADSAIIRDGRVVTAQALGGTGALRIGGDLIKRIVPGATVYISDPSWENHRALFEAAGFPVDTYPYYDPATRGANAEA
jgi:aromatic-amino-acid transaminase